MKKIYLVLFALISTLVTFGQTVIISEYVDACSGTTPKAIELWNPTAIDIDMSVTNIKIETQTNANSAWTLVATINTGTLEAGQVIVVSGAADVGINSSTCATKQNTTLSHSGDDAYRITLGATVTDIFGDPSTTDPGNGWSGGGVVTEGGTIELKAGIVTGEPAGWTDPSVRFQTVSSCPTTTTTGFGFPPGGCPVTSSPTLIATPSVLSGLDYTFNAGPSAIDSFVLSGANLTAAVSMAGAAHFGLSLDKVNFASFIVLAGTTINTTPTKIYVRLLAGQAIDSYLDTLTISSTGATDVDVYLSGDVTAVPIVCTPSLQTLPYNGIAGSAGFSHATASPPAVGPQLVCGTNFSLSYATTPSTDASTNEFGNQSVLGLSGLSSEDFGGVASFETYPIDISSVSAINIDAFGDEVGSGFNGTGEYLEWWYKLDGGAEVPFLTFDQNSTGTSLAASLSNLDVSLFDEIVVGFTFNMNGGSAGFENMDVTVTEYLPIPTIVVNPLAFSGLNYVLGSGPSASQSGDIQGFNLGGFVSGTAITNFEFSLDDITYQSFGGGIFPFVGTVSPTTVFLRLKAGLALGVYTETLSLTSVGAAQVDVTLSGEVTAPLPNIIINEFQADPDATNGDANGDGLVSTTNDEFIEFYNNEAVDVDMSGWTISDALSVQHTFPAATIVPAGGFITVFGGGNPANYTGVGGIFMAATPSGLSLNNGGDDIVLKNDLGATVASYTFSSANGSANQSIGRDPDFTGNFVNHSTIIAAGRLFSPGTLNVTTPSSCSITAISAAAPGACVPATNTYSVDVTVTYSNPPATGTLDVNGQSFALTSSPQTVSLTALVADGQAVDVTAVFADDISCTLTEAALFIAPSSCIVPIADCSELFFSEYIEGSSNNKCLEIYNPTANPIDMASGSYAIALYGNGSATATTGPIALSGVVPAYGTYVICNGSAASGFLALADTSGGFFNPLTFYNGNDVVALLKGGNFIDVIGQIGNNPGTNWSNAGVETSEMTLIRNASVKAGDNNELNAFDPSVQWTALPQNDFSNLGQHINDCAPLAWTGLTSSDWNVASNWNKGAVPLTNDAILIPTAPLGGIFPTTTSNIIVHDLTVENGATLTIGAGFALIIDGFGTATNNGTVVLAADATGTAWLDEFGLGGSYVGTITANQYVSVGSANGQRMFGSPVNNGVVQGLSQTYASGSTGQIIMTNCASAQVTASSPYNNLFEWHEDAVSPNNCEYEAWFARTQSTPLENGRGYSGWMLSGTNISFTGIPNSGSITYGGSLTNSNTGLLNKDGWHVLSNPYPSSINISGMPGWTSAQTYDASAAYGGTFQPILPGQDLGIAQGFVIKTIGANAVTFDDGMRTQGSTTFKSNNDWYDAKLEIEVNNTHSADITYIYFNQNASSGFDAQWDCEKKYSDPGRPTLYTKIDGLKTSLNGNNMAELGSYSFPLGLNPGGNNTCTFTVTGFETLPVSSLVYLEDKATGIWTNLREVNTYSFAMTTQENEERFELHFTKPLAITFEGESCEGNDGSLSVDFGNQTLAGNLLTWNYDVSKDMQSIANASEADMLVLESLAPGTYELNFVNGNYQFMETVIIEDKIQVEANVELPTIEIFVNDVVTINNLSLGADTYTWEINNETFNTLDLNYSFVQAGVYPFSLFASNLDCNALYEGTITVLDKTTGIKESVALANVRVYTKENTIVVDLSQANLSASTSLEVYNLLGQLVAQSLKVEEIEYIEMANQAKGYYFVRIINNQDQITKKVIIK